MGCGCGKNGGSRNNKSMVATAEQQKLINEARLRQQQSIEDEAPTWELRQIQWALKNGNMEDYIRLSNQRQQEIIENHKKVEKWRSEANENPQ